MASVSFEACIPLPGAPIGHPLIKCVTNCRNHSTYENKFISYSCFKMSFYPSFAKCHKYCNNNLPLQLLSCLFTMIVMLDEWNSVYDN